MFGIKLPKIKLGVRFTVKLVKFKKARKLQPLGIEFRKTWLEVYPFGCPYEEVSGECGCCPDSEEADLIGDYNLKHAIDEILTK